MHFKPFRLEARVAHDGGHKNELVARQRTVTPTVDDDPFGWLTSLFGDDPTSTTTRRTTTSTRAVATTSTPLLPTAPTSFSTSRTTSTSSRTPTSTAQVVTTPPPVAASSSRQTTTVFSTTSGDTSQANAENGSSPPTGLPSVVIGIIVAASVIFGLIFIALIARKLFQSRRRNRRNTWAHGSIIAPFSAPPITEKALPPPPPVEDNSYPVSYPAYPPATVAAPMAAFANPIHPYSPAAPSSAGYSVPYPYGVNNMQNTYQGVSTTAGAFNAADLAGPVVIQHTPPTPTVSAAVAAMSIVKRTFVPSLPDELSISNGDQVRVLSAYDDGWALCEKVTTGEKGVVPQECLEISKPMGSDESRLNRNSSLRRPQDKIN